MLSQVVRNRLSLVLSKSLVFLAATAVVSICNPQASIFVRSYDIVGLAYDAQCERNASIFQKAFSKLISNRKHELANFTDILSPRFHVMLPLQGCITGGQFAATTALANPAVQAVVGSIAENSCEAIASMTNLYQKYLVTPSCTTLSSADNVSFPKFIRSVPSDSSKAKALKEILSYTGWKYLVILLSKEAQWQGFSEAFEKEMRKEGFSVQAVIVIPENVSVEKIKEGLGVIVPPVKVVVTFMSLHRDLFAKVLMACNDLKLSDGRIALIAVHDAGLFHPRILPIIPDDSLSIWRALFIFTIVDNNQKYNDTWANPNLEQMFQDLLDEITVDQMYIFYKFYDALSLLLTSVLAEFHHDPEQCTRSTGNLKSTHFPSFLGKGSIDVNGERLVHYELLDYSPSNNSFRSVSTLAKNKTGHYVQLWRMEDIDWPQDLMLASDSHCSLLEGDCLAGTEDSLLTWSEESMVWVVSLGICTIGFIGASIITRKKLMFREMKQKLILKNEDVQFRKVAGKNDFPENQSSVNTTPSEALCSNSTLFLGVNQSSVLHISRKKETSTRHGPKAYLRNGEPVHLRYMEARPHFHVTSTSIKQLCLIYELRHENMNRFLGCVDNGLRPALVWEHCSRGTLSDALSRKELLLDWPFKLSLLTDLVKGLKYLHGSSLKFHGRLSSKNCVIDSRWMLKLTDFGVLPFYKAHRLPEPHYECKDLLWCAPEVVRNENLTGNQTSDIFSLSIVMQEVIAREKPYAMLGLQPEEIIRKLKKGNPIIRPMVPTQSAPDSTMALMQQCWLEQPEQRPTIQQVYEHFKRLNQGRKLNIIDTMFEMLERYSSNLEDLIEERTTALNEERKQTEMLLNRMLPRAVAENLKNGMPVQPEKFEEVTVYFSDIVGFTTISAYSEPMEIVTFLNDLYTVFDSTIDSYQVYKVETIGDAYMVVGGLPERREDHADQICTMALDLLHCCTKFKLPHMPTIPLLLRIGIHTGPVVAGVVGVTMPRYCLFGDTVNTASRMESTGKPYRIHVSKSTEKKLRQHGGYYVQFRGEIVLKGKGTQPTYWLTGKDEFDKELPKLPLEDAFCDGEMFRAIGRRLTEDSMIFSGDSSEDSSRDLPVVSCHEEPINKLLPSLLQNIARPNISNSP